MGGFALKRDISLKTVVISLKTVILPFYYHGVFCQNWEFTTFPGIYDIFGKFTTFPGILPLFRDFPLFPAVSGYP